MKKIQQHEISLMKNFQQQVFSLLLVEIVRCPGGCAVRLQAGDQLRFPGLGLA